MHNCDIAFENWQKYKGDFSNWMNSEISEADTRSKLLDIFLINILGWHENDIEREGYVKPGYFDYEVSTGTFKFIIEAKKNLHGFSLPNNHKKCKIKTLLNGNREVIEQIREYILKRNLTYGVISNGRQFIISKFVNSDGNKWENNECVIYHDINDIESRFMEFYNLLSREAIIENNTIQINREKAGGATLLSKLDRSDKALNRNELSDRLQPIVSEIFAELSKKTEEKNTELLKECYVKHDDVEKYNNDIGILFADDPPDFDTKISPQRNTTNLQNELSSYLNRSTEPIIIIGGKGAGKTTFINYFTEVFLDRNLRKKIPVVYIDFRDKTQQEIMDTEKIYGQILDELYKGHPELKLETLDILRIIYRQEIEKKKQFWISYQGEALEQKIADFLEEKIRDNINHFQYIVKYLNNPAHKKLCVIFDNGDQLDIDLQSKLFLLAHSIYQKTGIVIILALREGYYYQLRNKSPFDAYLSTVFHITAPPYREVIQKRLQYIVKHYQFGEVQGVYNDKHFSFRNKSLSELFKNLDKTLFHQSHSQILQFLEEMSYPNTRLGLELFRKFLISARTDVAQYLSSSNYNIPIWEFVKAVALESKVYYNHTESIICNLFYPVVGNTSHFTKIRIIRYLESKKSFTKISLLLEDFVKAGYNSKIIESEIIELIKYSLVETHKFALDTLSLNSVSINQDDDIRITQAGKYYISNLIYQFHYIELVLQDTVIYDENVLQKIYQDFPINHGEKRDIRKILPIVKHFTEYLVQSEKNEIRDESKDPNKINQNISQTIQKKIKRTIENIQSKF